MRAGQHELEKTLIVALGNGQLFRAPKLYEHWVVHEMLMEHVTTLSVKPAVAVKARLVSASSPDDDVDGWNAMPGKEHDILLPKSLQLDPSPTLSLQKLLARDDSNSSILAYPDVVNHPWVDAAVVVEQGVYDHP